MKGSRLAGLAALFSCTLPSFYAIDTVSSLEPEKYIGRWYQLFGNEFTSRITRDTTCIAADYGLDEASGNITVINSSRIRTPTGELNTISGYAYGTDPSEPGQLKVHLGQVPVDGDYWVVGLGPDTYGPDGAYEWALVSGPEAESLFVLVRDVPEFEEKFESEVLALVKDLGFTGRSKEPQRIVQEGCLPFHPAATAAQKMRKDWFDALATMKQDGLLEPGPASADKQATAGAERWADALAAMGEMEAHEPGVGAAASQKKQDWFDALATMNLDEVDGEGTDEQGRGSNAGGGGAKKGWADALAAMGAMEAGEAGAGKASQKKDWFDALAAMNLDEADEVPYPASDEDVNPEGGGSWADVLSKLEQSGEDGGSWSPVPTVSALDVNRYVGRWYQAYSSASASILIEQQGACVTADYGVEDATITVVNTARAQGVDGEVTKIKGTATAKNLMKPGQLTLHLDGTPESFGAPYWIVALGNENGRGEYPWAIVSDPLRAFLFVLVRDPEKFSGSKTETVVLAKCKKLGFTSAWNSPRKTVQEGCSYTPEPSSDSHAEDSKEVADAAAAAAAAAAADKPALSSVMELRGGAFGLGGPLHASCKMTVNFPKNYCDQVSGALVSAAEGMEGFERCNGGMKCGYTVSKVENGSVKLVHETSGKHYKDDMTFTLTDKEGGSCEAKAFSTSQTWYAVLDNSVNYCNLHNLVDACGLEYTETDVSDATCTQYSSADCEVY